MVNRRYPPWNLKQIFEPLDWNASTRSQTCGFFLSMAVCVMNAGLILEIGVAKGFFTEILLRSLGQSLAPERLLVSCDISPAACANANKFRLEGPVGHVVVCEDSSKVDWVARSDGRRFDIVVVDGGHDYQFVSEDVRRTKVAVKDGGLMVLHDHWEDMDGVVRAVREELPTWGKIQFPGNGGTNDTPFLVAQKPGGNVWGRSVLLVVPKEEIPRGVPVEGRFEKG